MKASEMFINSAINSFFHQWSEIDSDLSDGIFFPGAIYTMSKNLKKKWHLLFSQQFEILLEKAALMEAEEESEEKMFSNVDYSPLVICTVYTYYYCTFSLFLPLLWANLSSGLWTAYPFFDDFLRLTFPQPSNVLQNFAVHAVK